MYKYILEQAGNINWMAIFALLTFFFVFTVSVVTLFFRSREYIDKMSHLPLEDNDLTQNKNSSSHE
ncbi:MAG: hypothetical protein R3350_00650 [Saprospiraceae bacterium]|nr:hypothetical protein [Saprospiraceae bacterium]